MELTFLCDYAVPVVVGVCLCAGYILKHLVPTDKVNRYIPLLMGALGVGLNTWINRALTPQLLMEGMFSGLVSTGLYEAFRNLIRKEENKRNE